MDEEREIVIHVELTAADYRRVYWRQGRLIFLSFLAFVVLIGLVTFLFAIYLFTSPIPGPKKFLALIIPLIFLMFVSLVPIQILVNLWIRSKKLSEMAEPSVVTFSAHQVKGESPSSTIQTLYTRYVKVVETETDFVFFPQKQLFQLVPKRFFADHADISELRRRLVLNLGQKAKVFDN